MLEHEHLEKLQGDMISLLGHYQLKKFRNKFDPRFTVNVHVLNASKEIVRYASPLGHKPRQTCC